MHPRDLPTSHQAPPLSNLHLSHTEGWVPYVQTPDLCTKEPLAFPTSLFCLLINDFSDISFYKLVLIMIYCKQVSYVFRVHMKENQYKIRMQGPQGELGRGLPACSTLQQGSFSCFPMWFGKITQKRLVIKALKFNYDEGVLKEIKHSMITFEKYKFNREYRQIILSILVAHAFCHQGVRKDFESHY